MQSYPAGTTIPNPVPGTMNTAQPGGVSTGPQMTDDPSDPGSFVRDPHKLVAYIVPFPAPRLPAGHPEPPLRFVIYTPPPPPLLKPAEGQKEHVSHKVQRKWQEEVREAKESNAKVASWKGIKSRVTKGISWAVDRTTSADLDFITRIPEDDKKKHNASDDEHDHVEGDHTGRTVKLEEMVLVYPPTMNMSPEQLKTEFVNSLMRTKSKAERDAVIASGLLPVAAAADWALIFVGWVFGESRSGQHLLTSQAVFWRWTACGQLPLSVEQRLPALSPNDSRRRQSRATRTPATKASTSTLCLRLAPKCCSDTSRRNALSETRNGSAQPRVSRQPAASAPRRKRKSSR